MIFLSSMKVVFQAVVDKVETKKDNSLKITSFTAREMSATEMAALFSYKNRECWMLLSADDDLTEADVPDEKPDTMTGQKTKAQRLRAVIYRVWEQQGRKGTSEDHYNRVMEGIIDQMKEKLE